MMMKRKKYCQNLQKVMFLSDENHDPTVTGLCINT